ncbi:MAG: hypothetical protein PHW75_00530 [Patescibacteria group bacterium]|nr:hypothetical protein [Patescibacteria group bacterium]
MNVEKGPLEQSYELANLATFDATAFVGDESASQELCDFILTLAVMCNELKDLSNIKKEIITTSPVKIDSQLITPQKGNLGGYLAFILRLYILKVYEMSELFRSSLVLIESSQFEVYLKKISKKQREMWDSSVAMLTNNKADGKFNKVLTVVRHKTAGHCEAKEIAKGYRFYFIDRKGMEPYISFGDGIPSTRFHFADAAMEGYLLKKHKDLSAGYIEKEMDELISYLYNSVWLLVGKFVNSRSSWKKPTEDKLPEPEGFGVKGLRSKL